MVENKKVITDAARDFIHKNKTSDRQKGINPANHNTETKRYAKLGSQPQKNFFYKIKLSKPSLHRIDEDV